jgi:MinD superfamily P-loop ATPase
MVVSVASGKGGAGKTTVAVSLALALAGDGERPLLVDCDVEAPNAGLFLHPSPVNSRDVVVPVPEVDPGKCELCGHCAEVCAFHAITMIRDRVLLFPEMCHGCGSCSANCPAGAIRERDRVQGALRMESAGMVDLYSGSLEVGEAMPVPAIRQLKAWAGNGTGEWTARPVILDSPPGASCPVVETLRGSDFTLLVTECTPFGLHDLRLAVELARDEMELPVGVVVNRDGTGFDEVDTYCRSEALPVLMRIPDDRRIAESYSDGVPLVEAVPEYRPRFLDLYASILERQAVR